MSLNARLGSLRDILREIAFAARLLRRRPGSSLLLVATLAIGIGATVAMSSVAQIVFFRPVPYQHPEQLVEVKLRTLSQDGHVIDTGPSVGELDEWSKRLASFQEVGAWRFNTAVVFEDGDRAERIQGAQVRLVSETYFDMLGVRPQAGRIFNNLDFLTGADEVAVIGAGFWRRRFGGDPSVVGRVVTLQGRRVAIVGVLEAGFFDGPGERDVRVWQPLRADDFDRYRRATSIHAVGRLRPGVLQNAAATELNGLSAQLSGLGGELSPATAQLKALRTVVADDINFYNVRMLIAAAILILALAFTNVAGLSLASGLQRSSEMSIRAALGATRGKLFRQLLLESIVVSAIGGAVGLAIAYATVDVLAASLPGLLPPNTHVAIDFGSVAVAIATTLIISLITGWVPAGRLSRQQSNRPVVPWMSRRTTGRLIASQIALAVVLLSGAGLLARSLLIILSRDAGFDPNASLVVEIRPIDRVPASPSLLTVLRRAIAEVPGVEAVGMVDRLASGPANQTALAEGQSRPVSVRKVSPGFFEAIGVSLRQGRLPNEADAANKSVVLSERAAERLFAATSAVGQQVAIGGVTREVLGVVEDVNFAVPYGEVQPELYEINSQIGPGAPVTLIVRSRDTTPRMGDALRTAVQRSWSRTTVDEIQTVHDRLWSFEAVGIKRQQTSMLGLFAGIALVLSLVGVFAMTMNTTSRRSKEVGLRLALGATPTDAVLSIVGQSMRAGAVGLAIGLVASQLTSRLVANLLFQVRPIDILTICAVGLFVTAAVFLAAWLPARRVGRIDPAGVLKAE